MTILEESPTFIAWAGRIVADGVQSHWAESGEGPVVVVPNGHRQICRIEMGCLVVCPVGTDALVQGMDLSEDDVFGA